MAKKNQPSPAAGVVIYCRVSTAEQAQDGTSLTVQEAECRKRAEAEGWPVLGVFVDAGISGTAKPGHGKKQRPALAEAFALVESGQADALLCTKIDRLGRSSSVLHTLWDRLAEAGAKLVPVQDPTYDDTTAMGRLMRTVVGGFAEWEREVIAERTMSGRRERVQEGGWVGGITPLGYVVERDAEGKSPRLVPHPTEGPMIVRAVDLLLDQGMTTGQVADALNAEGLLPRKAPQWTGRNLRHMLTRSTYIAGSWTFGKDPSLKGTTPVTVQIPALVSPARYGAVRAYLKATTTGEKVVAHAHPLSGLIVGPCGHTYTGVHRGDRGNRRYRCCRAKQGKKQENTCSAPTYLADLLDAKAWAQVVRSLRDPSLLQAAAADYLGVLAGSVAAEADGLEKAEASVVAARAALSGAVTGCLVQGLDSATTEQVIGDLKDRLRVAEDHAAAIRAMQDSTSAQIAGLNQVQALALGMGDALEQAAPDLQRRVFRALGVQVRVDEIDCWGAPLAITVTGADALGLLRMAGVETLAPSTSDVTASPTVGAKVTVPFRLGVAA